MTKVTIHKGNFQKILSLDGMKRFNNCIIYATTATDDNGNDGLLLFIPGYHKINTIQQGDDLK